MHFRIQGKMNWGRGWILAALVSSSTFAGTATREASSVVVIVHLNNPTHNLSNNELRDLLLGRTNQWPDRRNVTLVEREPGSIVTNTVLRKSLNTTLDEYVHQLLALEFRGKTPPVIKTLKSDEGACSFVFNVPGAIGFISDRSMSLPSCLNQVKAIQISGKDFGAPGYPLSLEP